MAFFDIDDVWESQNMKDEMNTMCKSRLDSVHDFVVTEGKENLLPKDIHGVVQAVADIVKPTLQEHIEKSMSPNATQAIVMAVLQKSTPDIGEMVRSVVQIELSHILDVQDKHMSRLRQEVAYLRQEINDLRNDNKIEAQKMPTSDDNIEDIKITAALYVRQEFQQVHDRLDRQDLDQAAIKNNVEVIMGIVQDLQISAIGQNDSAYGSQYGPSYRSSPGRSVVQQASSLEGAETVAAGIGTNVQVYPIDQSDGCNVINSHKLHENFPQSDQTRISSQCDAQTCLDIIVDAIKNKARLIGVSGQFYDDLTVVEMVSYHLEHVLEISIDMLQLRTEEIIFDLDRMPTDDWVAAMRALYLQLPSTQILANKYNIDSAAGSPHIREQVREGILGATIDASHRALKMGVNPGADLVPNNTLEHIAFIGEQSLYNNCNDDEVVYMNKATEMCNNINNLAPQDWVKTVCNEIRPLINLHQPSPAVSAQPGEAYLVPTVHIPESVEMVDVRPSDVPNTDPQQAFEDDITTGSDLKVEMIVNSTSHWEQGSQTAKKTAPLRNPFGRGISHGHTNLKADSGLGLYRRYPPRLTAMDFDTDSEDEDSDAKLVSEKDQRYPTDYRQHGWSPVGNSEQPPVQAPELAYNENTSKTYRSLYTANRIVQYHELDELEYAEVDIDMENNNEEGYGIFRPQSLPTVEEGIDGTSFDQGNPPGRASSSLFWPSENGRFIREGGLSPSPPPKNVSELSDYEDEDDDDNNNKGEEPDASNIPPPSPQQSCWSMREDFPLNLEKEEENPPKSPPSTPPPTSKWAGVKRRSSDESISPRPTSRQKRFPSQWTMR
ncbi:hypothetical protein B0J11DRAFT_616058 [Dendryphion nanum]|uniref:Uncharacterized protein n=1 Tax=Dendryphion nanum TaxID=256645 RepID=A0A9P9DNH0_9PLEO|nr:hypothetical protein B0J11DRAFT_616058 [Dendryphion nanum]